MHMKHARYGNAHPHTALPFAVGHSGGTNKEPEGMQFFRMCRDAADNNSCKLNTRASDLPSWSSEGLSNFLPQSLPLANRKGLGHYLWWPWPVPALLSSNVASIGGNSTKPGSSTSYYALIKAASSHVLLSGNVASTGGNSTEPGFSVYH